MWDVVRPNWNIVIQIIRGMVWEGARRTWSRTQEKPSVLCYALLTSAIMVAAHCFSDANQALSCAFHTWPQGILDDYITWLAGWSIFRTTIYRGRAMYSYGYPPSDIFISCNYINIHKWSWMYIMLPERPAQTAIGRWLKDVCVHTGWLHRNAPR